MRYIDADALLKRLPDDLPYKGSVKRVLMQAPAVDAVEVVRCKDCVHWGGEKNCKNCLHLGACSKWTDFPIQCGFPVCAHFDGWISVEERLPEKDGLYIIVGRSGTPHAAHYYTGKRGFSNPYATHWMPLPEFTKGEQNEMQK